MSSTAMISKQYLAAAHRAGLSRAMVQTFAQIGYQPQPKQLKFHALCGRMDGNDVGYGGARGGGKTAATFAQAIVFALLYPGIKILFLRKIGVAGKNSLDDLRKRFLGRVRHKYNQTSGLIVLSNGSRIENGYFSKPGDIDRYQGIEYGLIIIEEATQLPFRTIELLSGSLRSNIIGWMPKMLLTANPGGVGHGWFKSRFINSENFVFATYRDNRYNDVGYANRLEALGGRLGEMWRDGNWDVAAGQFYDTFTSANKIEQSDALKIADTFWLSHDWGNSHPAATLLWCSFGEHIAVVREWRHRKTPPEELASDIIVGCRALGVDASRIDMLCGGDVFAERIYGSGTIGTTYEESGLAPISAKVGPGSVVTSAQFALNLFSAQRLFVAKNCTNLIETLENLPVDERNPERPAKVNADENGNGGDDFGDALRYGLPGDWAVTVL